MKILALDTSTEACSAALLIDSNLTQRYQVAPREHGALILPMIEELLSEAGLAPTQLDALAFGRGPGAFVGVRIAAGVAQGIAFAADLPVVPVSSLAALAQGVAHDHIYSAIDARMNEVYWGAYRKNSEGVVELLGEEIVCPPQSVSAMMENEQHWYGVGTGWGTYSEILQQQVKIVAYEDNVYPQAKHIAQIARQEYLRGQTVDAVNAMPTYLRNNVAKKSC
ncbi:MAG: tRNA threonylcarbamoyladenosine biosynthesis protein TsaB [Gammaproteobacteria bacterium SG8_11]|nr:MAG: tRNA threonylcarbamoyladenosine biosynthesis protein TsaB [Gammaproteobacteria bacterium SG8_11]